MKQKLIYMICLTGTILMSLTMDVRSADISITATVDRTTIAINQTFTLTIELSGEKVRSIKGDPKIPDMSAFATFLGSSGTSQNIQMGTGMGISITKSSSFSFMATTPGSFTIDPVTVEYKGKVYKTQPIPIKIVKQAARQRQPNSRNRNQNQQPQQQGIEDNLFLIPNIAKKTVYINEPLFLSYKMYTTLTVTTFRETKAPSTNGFWVENIPIGQQPEIKREMFKGRQFTTAELKKMVLFPTEAGEKEIGPAQMTFDVRVQRRSRSMFDSFFDDPFFGRSISQPVAAPPIKIKVLPLPLEGKPRDFSGAVGSFKLTASVDKKQVSANDAIALKVKIAGSGNIKIIPEPTIKFPDGFEQYDPKISENIDRKGSRVTGSKTFEYVLIPRFAGKKIIPAIVFNYFDPARKSYQSTQSAPLVVNVIKGKQEFVTAGSGLSKEEVQLLGKDIRFIQTNPPHLQKIGDYFYNSYLFIVLAILPLMLVGGAVGYRRHADKLSGNVAYARSRRANQMAMGRLKKAKKAMNESTQKEFYAETAQALVGFLADKLNIAGAGIITDQVEEMMISRNIEHGVIMQYMSCLKTCDFQRFAPANSSLDDMRQFYDQAKSAIVALEKEI